MAFYRGNGGSVIVVRAAGAGSDLVTPVTLNVTSWTLTKDPRLAETTHSGTSGASRYQKTVVDPSGTVEIPWDAAVLTDVDTTLDCGDTVHLKLMLGNSSKFYKLTDVTIDQVTPVCNSQNEIVRLSFTFKGGTITNPVTG